MLEVPVSLSPTRVSDFTTCGQAFKFKNIDKLPEPSSPEAEFGTDVHAILERVYGYDPEDRNFYTPFDEDPANDMAQRITQLEDPELVNVVGTELRLEGTIAGHGAVGIIDRLDEEDGELVIVDYKTGKVPSPSNALDKARGVFYYAMLVEQNYGKLPKEVRLYYLAKPVTVRATPTRSILEGMEIRQAAMWNAIEYACENDSFQPKVSPLCSWCSFQSICPAWI